MIFLLICTKNCFLELICYAVHLFTKNILYINKLFLDEREETYEENYSNVINWNSNFWWIWS